MFFDTRMSASALYYKTVWSVNPFFARFFAIFCVCPEPADASLFSIYTRLRFVAKKPTERRLGKETACCSKVKKGCDPNEERGLAPP